MTGDYLVLAWPAADRSGMVQAQAQRQELEQLGWTRAVARAGLEVWVRGVRAPCVRQVAGAGVVLIGRTFPRLSSQPQPRRAAVSAVPAAAAVELCHDLWGAFIALVPDSSSGIPLVLRDPSGSLEAFTWRRGALSVLASDLDAAPAGLGPESLSLDWDVVVDFLRRPAALGGRCALNGIQPVAPGSLQPLGEEPDKALAIWRPLDWSAAEVGGSESAPVRLNRTLLETVRTLASPYDTLVAEISGGLDSSIVAAALGAAGLQARTAAALHYVGDLPESDERPWAEVLSGRWGLPLECAPRALAPFDPERDFEPLARGARPPVAALDAWRDRDVAERLARRSAQALFTGVGGDAVFFQMPTAAVICDLWVDRGVGALTDPLVRDVARQLRRSVWSVAAEAVALARRPPHDPAAGPLLGARARAPTAGPPHPWLAGLADAPPAKRLQIASLAALQGLRGRSRCAELVDVVHPLLSQPVMEVCLAIPTWRHVRGGQDRALARAAMAELLPVELAARRSKGELTSYFARRLAGSLDLMRPYLLDGVLVRAEVLDRKAVEAALDPDALIRSSEGLALISAAAVEAWVRWWQTRVPDSASAPRRR